MDWRIIVIVVSILVIIKILAPRIILWWMMDYKGPVPKWYPFWINPWLFGLAIGRMPHKKNEENNEKPTE